NIPPTRKMIEDGKTGFLVSGWDPSVWANRTVELLGNPLLRKNTGDEARRFVCETFDASRWAREIETLFEALVPLRRRRSFSSRFVKSVYFPFIQILKREKGRGVLKRMEENQWLTREELEKSQWGALRQLLFHACGHVPYYREKFEKLGVHPKEIANDEMFRRIPLLSKEEVVEHHESFLSSCYPGRRWEGKTSGSTGISLRFHYDSSHESYVWASVWRGRRWWDVDVGDREVDLWGRPLGSKRLDFTWQVKSRLRNVLHFSSYVLDERRMGEYAEVIKHFRPALLYGYSSSIVQFGEFVACKGYCFPSLRLVECTADELLTSQKIRLEKIFNCPVVSAYGASEAGGIAQECLEGNLHISMEHMKIEFLQEGQPAPPHETSEIVVTTLRNFAMPLIRYRIGDVGTFLEKTCPCGRGLPLMELHIGKSSSIIQTSLTSAVSSKLFDYINVGLMREGLAGIRQFKVQQTGRDSFNLLIVKESAFSERSVQFFKDRMKEYLGNHIIIETSFVDKIRRDTTGKLRYFEQIVSEKVP
ncbi:MAG: hypothetical protein HY590_04110, partial [Candidatus Omnitrophica bacterium]|nr:hypothetical protein [Candidatus Omnitrophota bacterium]